MLDNIENKKNLSRRERERAQHRKEIMDAAIKVFAEKGYHEATLEEISQEAEFSKGALYLYFSNKEDILFSILEDMFEGLERFFSNILTGERNFRVELTLMYKGIAEEIFKRTDIFRLISAQRASFFRNISDENRTTLIDKHNRFWNDFGEQVQNAIDDGELRDIPVVGIVGLIHGALDSLVHSHWDCETIEEVNGAIDIFMEILFNGIANNKEV
ncbi:TetR/AcrR family transcriptional regulator [Candidatus Latescibacterota bacterium]